MIIEDIRPLKGPAELWDWWVFLKWLLWVLLAAAGIIGLIYLWKKKRRPMRETVEEGPPKPPHEVALEALSRLENSGLLQKRQVKLFYMELSDILRRYLTALFEMDALDRTTWEIHQVLRNRGVSLSTSDTTRDILEEADLVKFAKYFPPPEVPLMTLERTRTLIKETMPCVSPTPPS